MTAIPERIDVDLLNGINGIKFRYFESTKDDTHRDMSNLLYLALMVFTRILKGLGVVRIYHQGIFNDRNIAGTNRKSNHAYACAIDFWAFEFADGRIIQVSQHPHAFLSDVIKICRDIFSEVVAPPSKNHADHIHAGFNGSKYESEKSAFRKRLDKLNEQQMPVADELYTAEEKAIALAILKESVWGDYAVSSGDPGTKVRNVITGLTKHEFKLE